MRPDLGDEDRSHDAFLLLHLMENSLADANLSLVLFVDACLADAVADSRAEWEARSVTVRAIQDELRAALPQDLPWEARFEAEQGLHDAASAEAVRRLWTSGVLPEALRHRLPSLYARSFIFAVDGFIKALEQLAATDGVPTDVRNDLDQLKGVLPDAIHVRDTVHHHEDRIRGLGRRGAIQLQPIDNSFIRAPGGAIVLDSLNGNRYGCTLGDGRYGEVEVSDATLLAMRNAFQTVVSRFTWTGPGSHWPRS